MLLAQIKSSYSSGAESSSDNDETEKEEKSSKKVKDKDEDDDDEDNDNDQGWILAKYSLYKELIFFTLSRLKLFHFS